MSVRVLIVDDQGLVRAGFRMILEAEQDIEVVGEAANGLEAIAEAARLEPDVVLMDVRMPELDGIEATRRLLANGASATKVVMLTTFDMDEYVYDALRAGASAGASSGRRRTPTSRRISASASRPVCSTTRRASRSRT